MTELAWLGRRLTDNVRIIDGVLLTIGTYANNFLSRETIYTICRLAVNLLQNYGRLVIDLL